MANLSFQSVFNLIENYHKELGYNDRVDCDNPAHRIERARHISLALYQEVAELVDSFPWKPWREPKDQVYDRSNIKVELVDLIFFITAIMEIFDITPGEMELQFKAKLRENYDRIRRGYHGDKGESFRRENNQHG